jgi:hypothetical protein
MAVSKSHRLYMNTIIIIYKWCIELRCISEHNVSGCFAP